MKFQIMNERSASMGDAELRKNPTLGFFQIREFSASERRSGITKHPTGRSAAAEKCKITSCQNCIALLWNCSFDAKAYVCLFCMGRGNRKKFDLKEA